MAGAVTKGKHIPVSSRYVVVTGLLASEAQRQASLGGIFIYEAKAVSKDYQLGKASHVL